eukprot:jgi/Mesvir1/3551/Mv12017-RA.1
MRADLEERIQLLDGERHMAARRVAELELISRRDHIRMYEVEETLREKGSRLRHLEEVGQQLTRERDMCQEDRGKLAEDLERTIEMYNRRMRSMEVLTQERDLALKAQERAEDLMQQMVEQLEQAIEERDELAEQIERVKAAVKELGVSVPGLT